MRWLSWLWYTHDPEVHRLLREIANRLGAPESVTAEPRSLRHDCGHRDTGYAKDGDGRTECRACYAKRWVA